MGRLRLLLILMGMGTLVFLFPWWHQGEQGNGQPPLPGAGGVWRVAQAPLKAVAYDGNRFVAVGVGASW